MLAGNRQDFLVASPYNVHAECRPNNAKAVHICCRNVHRSCAPQACVHAQDLAGLICRHIRKPLDRMIGLLDTEMIQTSSQNTRDVPDESCRHPRESTRTIDITVHYHTGLCHAVYLSGLLGTRLIEIPAQDGPDISDLAVGRHLIRLCAGGNHASAAAWAVGDMQLCPICVPLHQHQHKEVRCALPGECNNRVRDVSS